MAETTIANNPNNVAEPTPNVPQEDKGLGDLNLELDNEKIKNIDKENIKNTLVNFIIPLISLFVIVILIAAVAVPTYSDLPELKQELDAKASKRGLLETKKGVLNRLSNFEDVVEEDTELFKQALVSEPMVPELLTQIDTIANESGLQVIKLSNSLSGANGGANGAPEGTDYNIVTVTLGVSGGYDELVLFNENLENSTRLVMVDDFRFSAESNDDLGDYTATFVLKSPYLTISTEAVTDDPITVDISNPGFLEVVEKIKSMKHYDITVQDYILENLEQQEQDEEEEAAEEDAEQTEETPTEETTEEDTTTEEEAATEEETVTEETTN